MTREFVPPKATLNVLGLRSSTIALRVSVTGSRSGNCRLEWPHRKGRLTTGSTTPKPQPAPTSWHLMQKNSISAATFQCAPHSENAASRIAASGSSHPCSPRSNTERSRQRARFDGSHDRRRSGDHDSCACHVAVCRSGRVSARRLFGSCAANVDLWQERAEAARILLTSSSHSGMSSEDRAYLVQLVSANTGLSLGQKPKNERTWLSQALRPPYQNRSSVILAFSITAALLLGAVIAWTAAGIGGRHRDGAPMPLRMRTHRHGTEYPREIA